MLIHNLSADSKLKQRPIIQGITIGLSDNILAATGFYICIDIILVGNTEHSQLLEKSNKIIKLSESRTSAINDTLNNHIWTMYKSKRKHCWTYY